MATEVATSGTLPRSGDLEQGLGRGGSSAGADLAGQRRGCPRQRELPAQRLGGQEGGWKESSSPMQRDPAEAGYGRAGAGRAVRVEAGPLACRACSPSAPGAETRLGLCSVSPSLNNGDAIFKDPGTGLSPSSGHLWTPEAAEVPHEHQDPVSQWALLGDQEASVLTWGDSSI